MTVLSTNNPTAFLYPVHHLTTKWWRNSTIATSFKQTDVLPFDRKLKTSAFHIRNTISITKYFNSQIKMSKDLLLGQLE